MKAKEILLGYVEPCRWKAGDKLYQSWMKECPEDYEGELKIDENEIILPGNKNFILKITYPLHTPFILKFKTPESGMKRKDFVKIAVDCYRHIYEMEDRTSKIAATNIPGMMNRISTVGRYGIWGHSIDDLIIHTLYVSGSKLSLGVDS